MKVVLVSLIREVGFVFSISGDGSNSTVLGSLYAFFLNLCGSHSHFMSLAVGLELGETLL